MRLDALFDVAYGNKFDLNKMTVADSGVLFVGRSGKNQGVSALVKKIDGVEPYPAGLMTVALGGASRLATFVQQLPFYTAQNVAVLTPKSDMSLDEKFYWATCIRANRFRYEGFGREANRTLHILELPERAEVSLVPSKRIFEKVSDKVPRLTGTSDRLGRPGGSVGDLFDVRYGHSLELNRLSKTDAPRGVNFVSRTDKMNGVSARVIIGADVEPAVPGELSVALGGSPLATFLQNDFFVCGRDVAVLTAKEHMTDAEKLFWAMCIRANRYRFSYGRQANRTLRQISLPELPAGFASQSTVDGVTTDLRHGLRAAGDGEPSSILDAI